MDAKPCQIIEFFNGTKQYLVPLFQRPYEWKQNHWKTFWDDLLDRYERGAADSVSHFTGAIVTAPARSVPVGVSKHLIIDGQQRLTTVALLVCAIRSLVEEDSARFRKLSRLLINEDDEGLDYYKILPTQFDREAFFALVRGRPIAGTRVTEAYDFFRDCLKRGDSDDNTIDLERFIETLNSLITVVSINLSDADDPYLIFESLNAKGAPLTQADLIRNYVLLRLHAQAQEEAYSKYWVPMQHLLPTEYLTEYMRQYLMMSGEEVSKSEIYAVLKRRFAEIPDKDVLDRLKELHSCAVLYSYMVGLQQYSDTAIDTALGRLRRLEMSVASPLLLRLLSAKADGLISAGDVLGVLAALESFFIRRMVCRVPTNQLKRIFLGLTRELPQEYPVPFVVRYLANGVSGRRWPKDEEFRNEWLVYPAYSGSNDRCRLVLETLEADYAHKEPASFEAATIEHIMPQTLTDHWRNHLGDEAERVHEQFRDTIGNLALTAYNSELSNAPFEKKVLLFHKSHFESTKAIAASSIWNASSIQNRGLDLFARACRIWSRPIGDVG
ncbi:MAG TPA: DUF262 domain-containing protein [Gemmatimonas aurantiaca]|uniref:DUF262 domain-containing protein n=2 Tax=Gemmatimonas aurantiaca TaxID=173480 RepID=C1AE43_GEMAT|nr:DUF262 domain-containing protein [Gemmatimonas aurantiaca]BAH40770.1 hypothetical protein GAU_3728 [Gemmatimonas aurantiaca T-27]HCT59135.1 DUF262 domain-containing protein [Gemmatimonas aurantiaca]